MFVLSIFGTLFETLGDLLYKLFPAQFREKRLQQKLKNAKKLRSAKQYSKSIKKFESAIRYVGESVIDLVEAYYQLGLAYYEMGGSEDLALAQFTKCLQLKKDNYESLIMIGRIYYQRGSDTISSRKDQEKNQSDILEMENRSQIPRKIEIVPNPRFVEIDSSEINILSLNDLYVNNKLKEGIVPFEKCKSAWKRAVCLAPSQYPDIEFWLSTTTLNFHDRDFY